MTRREKAIRAAVESLNMSREAKDAIVDIWREVDNSYAEAVRDLKARLKAVRDASSVARFDPDTLEEWELIIKRATNLRVKNWRKP